MFISKQLKETNVAEYLLYMWQVEDVIRSQQGDIELLKKNYLCRFELTEEQRPELEQWYLDLIQMMRDEDVWEKGHLQINKNIILLLTDLHTQLLASSKYPFYSAAYYKALPYIVELRSKGRKDVPELETCFEALYGVMMLRVQGKTVGDATVKALADITKLLGMLSDYYRQDKAGELDLE